MATNIIETTPRTTVTKSPLTLAKSALAQAEAAVPAYASKYSRHDYTQHQMLALLALRARLKTDYRGLEALLRDWAELREALGLSKVPDHTTIQRAANRLRAHAGTSAAPSRPHLRTRRRGEVAMPLFATVGHAEADSDRPADEPTPNRAGDRDNAR